jgi:hypothetical protein
MASEAKPSSGAVSRSDDGALRRFILKPDRLWRAKAAGAR